MRNFQDTSKTRKRSFISAFSICMAVPLRYKALFSTLSWKMRNIVLSVLQYEEGYKHLST